MTSPPSGLIPRTASCFVGRSILALLPCANSDGLGALKLGQVLQKGPQTFDDFSTTAVGTGRVPMSYSQSIRGLDPRVCPRCGAVQQSPGSTFCEQCGATLSRLEVVPPRPKAGVRRPRLAISSALSAVIRQPAFLVKRVLGLIRSLTSLVVRGVALVLVLYALVIGLSLVPQVRGNVPPLKQVALTGLSWVQRAAQESAKLQASLNAPAPALRQSAATSQKPVPAQAASAQPVTVKSTPSGAIVVLDARQVGKTPMTIKVPPGIHRITVVQSGYASITRTLTVRSDLFR